MHKNYGELSKICQLFKEYLTYETQIRTEEKNKWGEIKAIVGTMCIEVKDYDNKSAHKFAHTILVGKLLNRPESHIEGRMKTSVQLLQRLA